MSKNNQQDSSDTKTPQHQSNQRDKPSCVSYVRHDKAKQQTAKARAKFLSNKAVEYEKRLQRMGLGEHSAAHINSLNIEYGANYLPDSTNFNYHKLGNNTPYASIFGTSSINDELSDMHQVMSADSQPRRPSKEGKSKTFWPNAEEARPGYRMFINGGKEPTIVAGNYNHRLEVGDL